MLPTCQFYIVNPTSVKDDFAEVKIYFITKWNQNSTLIGYSKNIHFEIFVEILHKTPVTKAFLSCGIAKKDLSRGVF